MNEEEQQNRLLIVDDDQAFCNALARNMQRRGFEVFKALDSKAALAQADAHQPEYGIIDLRIGEESGLELVRQLAEKYPQMYLLVLTGFASIATAVEAIKLGAVQYLTKPAEPEQIIAALKGDAADAQVPLPEKPMSVRRLEWEHIQKVLQEHNGNISAAARALGMHRRTLQRKLQKHPVKQ